MKNILSIYSDALDELMRENQRFARGIRFGMKDAGCFESEVRTIAPFSFETSNFTGEVAYGISQVVVILDNYDWVVQIPFFCPDNGERDEIEFYNMIPEESKKFFARSSYHFLWHAEEDHKVIYYLQEKASTDVGQVMSDLSSAADLFSDQNATNEGLDLFTNYYDDDDLQILEKIVCDYDLYDIHTDNIGYNAEGKPVVIDYSFYSA